MDFLIKIQLNHWHQLISHWRARSVRTTVRHLIASNIQILGLFWNTLYCIVSNISYTTHNITCTSVACTCQMLEARTPCLVLTCRLSSWRRDQLRLSGSSAQWVGCVISFVICYFRLWPFWTIMPHDASLLPNLT